MVTVDLASPAWCCIYVLALVTLLRRIKKKKPSPHSFVSSVSSCSCSVVDSRISDDFLTMCNEEDSACGGHSEYLDFLRSPRTIQTPCKPTSFRPFPLHTVSLPSGSHVGESLPLDSEVPNKTVAECAATIRLEQLPVDAHRTSKNTGSDKHSQMKSFRDYSVTKLNAALSSYKCHVQNHFRVPS